MKKIKEFIISFINGFCMSLADSVPGVSGGTVAFTQAWRFCAVFLRQVPRSYGLPLLLSP